MNLSPKAAMGLGGAAIVLGLLMMFVFGSTFGGIIVGIAGILFLAVGFMQQG